MKWRRLIGLLLIVVALAGAWLLGSSSGLEALLRVASQLSPVGLTVGSAEGRLWNDVTLHDLSVDTPAARVSVDRLRLQWRLPRLLGAAVEIQRLEADGITVLTRDTDSAPQPPAATEHNRISLPDISLPITISLEQLAVRGVNIQTATPVHIETIDAVATYNKSGLNLTSFAVAMTQGGAQLRGRINPSGDYPVQLSGLWHWQDPAFAPLAGKLEAAGSVAKLELRHDLLAPRAMILQATATNLLENLAWNAELKLAPTDPSALRSDWPAAQVELAVSADGTLETLNAKAKVAAAANEMQVQSSLDVELAGPRLQINGWRTQLKPGTAEVNAKGELLLAGADSTAKLEGHWSNLVWPLAGAKQVESTRGTWQFEGGMDEFVARIESKMATFDPLPQRLDLQADLSGNTEHVKINALQVRADDGQLDASGQVTFAPSLGFDIGAAWPQWSIAAPALAEPIQLRNGTLQARGGLDHYIIDLATNTRAEGIDIDKLTVSAEGNLEQIEITKLSGGALAGSVEGSAHVAWQPALSWRSQFRVRKAQPDRYWPELPGEVSFDLNSDGRINGGVEVNATLESLSGHLRQQALSGFVVASFKDGVLSVDPAVVRLGSSQLVAQGRALKSWSLSWQAELPDLTELGFGLRGEALTAGDLAASEFGPQVALRLSGRNLSYEKNRIGSIQADARTVLDEKLLSYLTLNSEDIELGGKQIEQIRVTGHGNLKDHFLAGYVAQETASLALHARGGYVNERWDGDLLSSMFALGKVGQWDQRAASDLVLTKDSLKLGKTCWSHDESELCLDGNWDANQAWASKVHSPALPLSLLAPWLPETITTKGAFKLDASVAGDGVSLANAEVSLASPQGKMNFIVNDTETTAIDYKNAQVKGRWTNEGIRLSAGVELNNRDRLDAKLRIAAAPNQPLSTAPLDGKVNFTFGRLGILPALLPAIDKTEGALQGTFTVGGTVDAPRVGGSARIEKGLISIAQAGVTLEDINLKLKTDAHTLRYGLSIRSGPGQISADGRVDWSPGSDFATSLLITGNDFEVMNTREYLIRVAPELSISSSANETSVVGTVGIPLARLRPKEFGGAVTPSSDVVIVDEHKENGTPMQVTSVVRLSLGDKVDFEGFGLKAKFAGDMVVMDSPKQLTSAHGEIRVTQGEYSAFGEKLDIKRGRLVFLGGIIDDPGLDIRASRDIRGIESITVGVNVQGTLRDPRLSVYTLPPTSESDALSYLMFGRPMQQGSSEEGTSVYSAASSAAFAGGAFVAKQVASSIGLEIEDLEISAQGYSVGKYLSPKLYVSYGRDIIDQVNVFRIRYILSSRWALEADSGKGQGADVLYTLERD